MMVAGKAKPTAQIKSEPFEGCFECYGGNGVRGYVDEYNYEGTYSIVGRQGALCGNINTVLGKFYATEHAVVTIYENLLSKVNRGFLTLPSEANLFRKIQMMSLLLFCLNASVQRKKN